MVLEELRVLHLDQQATGSGLVFASILQCGSPSQDYTFPKFILSSNICTTSMIKFLLNEVFSREAEQVISVSSRPSITTTLLGTGQTGLERDFVSKTDLIQKFLLNKL